MKSWAFYEISVIDYLLHILVLEGVFQVSDDVLDDAEIVGLEVAVSDLVGRSVEDLDVDEGSDIFGVGGQLLVQLLSDLVGILVQEGEIVVDIDEISEGELLGLAHGPNLVEQGLLRFESHVRV